MPTDSKVGVTPSSLRGNAMAANTSEVFKRAYRDFHCVLPACLPLYGNAQIADLADWQLQLQSP